MANIKMKYTFEKISYSEIPWDSLESCYDHTIFKSREWACFLEEHYHIKPYVLSIRHNNTLIGFFYGQQIKKMGIKIVASPFEGWSTSYQGLSMLNVISKNERLDIYEDLIAWLFKNKECLLFQVSDWQLDVAECLHRDLNVELIKGYILDLSPEEEILYKNLSSRAKDPIKKAKNKGVTVHLAYDLQKYADEYYNELVDVFATQKLPPTHSKDQISHLLTHVALGNKLLAMYSEDKDKNSLATSFFVYDNAFAFYAGAASYVQAKKIAPNEILMWESIKELKKREIRYLEFGGGRRYKEKYGPLPYVKPKIIVARYPVILELKNIAKGMYYGSRRLFSKVRGSKVKGTSKID